MINAKFHWLLHEPRAAKGRPLWTVARMADELYLGRSHLTEVLNNKPKRGAQTRPKVLKFFRRHFKEKLPEILKALGWDEHGNIMSAEPEVPRGTFHGEQLQEKS